jgi:hypothetical protein
MDSDDLLKDDFLASLLKKMPLESPSDDFENNVMRGIEPLGQTVKEKRPFYQWTKAALPYVALGIIVVFIIISSDMPYLNFRWGAEYFSALFIKVFNPLWASLKIAFSSKFMTYSLLIGVSAGFIFIVDKLFSRRFTA